MATKMAKEEVLHYRLDNIDALSMISYGIDDYIASRCLLINCLFTGLVLAAQAVEKYLKGYILFFEKDFRPKKSLHHILTLADELQSYQDFGLSEYKPLFERLERHYETRYPDNPNQSTYMGTEELDEIDSFIIHLNDSLPAPDEIKYGFGLYRKLFIGIENNLPQGKLPQERWLLKDNYALLNNYAYIRQRYEEFKDIL